MDQSPSTSSYNAGRADDLASMGTQRRSSSRSIRRKKFDDELVEYSTRPAEAYVSPVPGSTKTLRVRSQSVPSSSGDVALMAPVSSSIGRKSSSRKSGKYRRSRHSVSSTKDLGRWKPTDDLALIIAVTQTCDLRMVERGVKFSCRFTHSEISQRWQALLYDPVVSRVAMAAIQNLHPDLVSVVRSKALYSSAEEDLLSRIPSTLEPSLEVFENLLETHPQTFYHSRTPKQLHAHWTMMRHYYLLKDQIIVEQESTFSDVEETLNDSVLAEPRDEALEQEILIADRRSKREIRTLEEELSRLQVIVESVTPSVSSSSSRTGMDSKTYAVLRGRFVRYLMRYNDVSIGRGTKTHKVDIDLNVDARGPAMKVSRRQGTIVYRHGNFFFCNEGKRAVFIDGRPVLTGYKQRLSNESVIEIAGFQFSFLINPGVMEEVHIAQLRERVPP